MIDDRIERLCGKVEHKRRIIFQLMANHTKQIIIKANIYELEKMEKKLEKLKRRRLKCLLRL